jgi:hypothetical protein
MPIRPSDPFFGRHYEGPIILVCVRWYLRLPLSYRQVADLMTPEAFMSTLPASGVGSKSSGRNSISAAVLT